MFELKKKQNYFLNIKFKKKRLILERHRHRFNESSIEDKSLSANEIDIEIDNQINNSNSCNRPNRRKRIYWRNFI